MPYRYLSKIVRVVDGDTLDVEIDLGFHTWRRDRVRLLGVNCPEKHGETKEAGLQAKQFTQEWCDARSGLVEIATTIDPNDSFGRVLADVYDREHTGNTLTGALIVSGHGVPYKEKR